MIEDRYETPEIDNVDERSVVNSLRDIGMQLDRHQYPRVYDEGIVRPADTPVVQLIAGEGSTNEQARRTRRSATRSWQGTEGRKRSTSRQRPTDPPPFIRSDSLRQSYEAQLDEILDAYSSTQVFYQADGMWLLTESTVLPGLGKKATFLVALPYSPLHPVKSWAFWTTSVSMEWIGPRHTNFPDGSICANTQEDNSWKIGGNIVTLLDIYSLWALKQEYCRVFKRWPGNQAAQFPYERILELQPDEICGCDTQTKLYQECCGPKDSKLNMIEVAVDYFTYVSFGKNGLRSPPDCVWNFIRHKNHPPNIEKIVEYIIR